jgi:hypothetical protein
MILSFSALFMISIRGCSARGAVGEIEVGLGLRREKAKPD